MQSGSMYDEVSHKRLRGPAFTVLGSFVLVYSTSLMLSYKGNPSYLAIALASLGVVTVADIGIRSSKTLHSSLFLSISGGLLAAEATVIMIAFPEWFSISFTMIAIAGSLLVLRGIHDVQNVKHLLNRERPTPNITQP
ncbi:MAG: hypothetical protein HYY22_01555 [Thaumarchaeota archaeon]|nr:hypothetical protein [Nitrososphaerota archaeon]